MRQDVDFQGDGPRLRGWLYTPDTGDGPFPTVVMAHGFSAVKEMYLDRFAEVFARAGLAALVFDHRNFGASDGEPRQEIDPWAQVRDYRDAITYAHTRPEVDRERIGVWGSSYSGGHVLVVAAIDRRVRCAVAQVPLVSGYHNILRLVRADMWPRRAPCATGPRGPLRRPAGHDPVVQRRPGRTGRAAHGRLVPVVHRNGPNAGAGLEERGHAPHGRDAHGVRAGAYISASARRPC